MAIMLRAEYMSNHAMRSQIAVQAGTQDKAIAEVYEGLASIHLLLDLAAVSSSGLQAGLLSNASMAAVNTWHNESTGTRKGPCETLCMSGQVQHGQVPLRHEKGL